MFASKVQRGCASFCYQALAKANILTSQPLCVDSLLLAQHHLYWTDTSAVVADLLCVNYY